MLKIKSNVRQVLKAQAKLAKVADQNIKIALVELRNDTIKDIQDGMNSPDFWYYSGEHLPGAYGRDNGSQVRTTETSDFFKFRRPTQIFGKTPFANIIIENGDPDGIGEFLLSGTSPHSIPQGDRLDYNMKWQHEYQDPGAARQVSHPGAVSKFDDIYKLASDAHKFWFEFHHARLIAEGDGIFKPLLRGGGFVNRSKQINPGS